ncbi:hypothetical protein [Aquamicrobium sp.]|uniref:hypothetical protein n=1 Tax=Aquamicrobium sp. TaxID=1872579 RepID=UPI00258EB61F|nr:hypothetical protein [Aquamicrobium sp.]MCK9549121.1 hypothetical protein [Aquamicrobium sp.]
MLDTIEGHVEAGGEVAAPAIVRSRLRGIAVLGSHPQTKRLAPYHDDGFLIYACSPDNSPYGFSPDACAPPRVDQFFEIHRPVFDRSRPYEYLDWLRNIPVVWMRDPVAIRFRAENGEPLFPTARLYPEKEMKARFGAFTFTSSIAFIMAKAIVDIEKMMDEGRMGGSEPPMLGLWGILQSSKVEYEKQRQGTQNMIWQATQSGIKVLAAQESRLFDPPPEDF